MYNREGGMHKCVKNQEMPDAFWFDKEEEESRANFKWENIRSNAVNKSCLVF
jgi:hypothetical protein